MSIFDDPNFDEMFQNAIYNSRTDDVDAVGQQDDFDVNTLELDEWDDDCQPTLYDEAQDLYGGDDYVEQWEIESWD